MIIGVVGGMGSFATLKIFEKYLKIFKAEKEWERPRIIIDNNCTMPSRVLAYENGYRRDELIQSLLCSVDNLVRSGCTHIFFGCNTCHLFLNDIIKEKPYIERYIVSMHDLVHDYIKESGINILHILSTEATRKSGLYDKVLSDLNVKIEYPIKDDKIRYYIEKIKSGNFKQIKQDIEKETLPYLNVMAGCTEFEYLDNVISPVEITLNYLYKVFLNEKQ